MPTDGPPGRDTPPPPTPPTPRPPDVTPRDKAEALDRSDHARPAGRPNADRRQDHTDTSPSPTGTDHKAALLDADRPPHRTDAPTASTATDRKAALLDAAPQPSRPDTTPPDPPREIPPRPEISERAFKHILDGEWNSKGRPVGFHSAPDGVTPPDRRLGERRVTYDNGTYEAGVAFRKEPDSAWVDKPVRRHTMFPDGWSREKVVSAVQETYQDVYERQIGPALQRGENPANSKNLKGQYDGIEIRFYVDSRGAVRTAFPANPD